MLFRSGSDASCSPRPLIGRFRLAKLAARFKQDGAAGFEIRLPQLSPLLIGGSPFRMAAGPRFRDHRLGAAHVALGLGNVTRGQQESASWTGWRWAPILSAWDGLMVSLEIS